MADDSVKKTVFVALSVCIVCSLIVSATAVSLKEIQKENRRLDRIKNILRAGDLRSLDKKDSDVYSEKIRPIMINLRSGKEITEEELNELLDIEKFEVSKVADDPVYGRQLTPGVDIAGLGRVPAYMVLYTVIENDEIKKVILPVYGKGLWSMMHGFIALGKDLKTVKGFTIYEHAETPGLGGEISDPEWQNGWRNKHLFDLEGNMKLRVIKGRVDSSREDSKFRIEGISGATLTSRGVENMVRFWLGEEGYGPFLKSGYIR